MTDEITDEFTIEELEASMTPPAAADPFADDEPDAGDLQDADDY